MFARRWFVVLGAVWALAAVAMVEGAVAGEQEKTARGGQIACADLEASRLNLQQPVSINGPWPTVLRKARVGELIQLQVRYPMAPPMPEKACVEVDSRALTALYVVGTDNEVAILGPKPQTGVIGNGYISAYVRANSPGQARATVIAVLSDGTKKKVPFAFQIKGRGKEKKEPAPDSRTGTIEVFAYPYVLSRNDKLTDGPSHNAKPMDIDRESMLLWVDLQPGYRFAHPTLYALISGGGARVVKGGWWPVLNGKALFRGPNQATVMSPTVFQRIRPQEATKPGTVEVYLFPYELTPQDELRDGSAEGNKPMSIKSETMLVWVDLLPEAKFAHPTLYVLISGSGARVENGKWWPVLNGKALFQGPNQAGVTAPTVIRNR